MMDTFLQLGLPAHSSPSRPHQLNTNACRLGAIAQRRYHALSFENSFGRLKEASLCAFAAAVSIAVTGAARIRSRARRHLGPRLRASKLATVSAVKQSETWDLLFQDYATWLVGHFDSEIGLKETLLPANLKVRKGEPKGSTCAEIRTKVYVGKRIGSPIRKLRMTMVCNGSELQALNAVVYPALELGPLPVLGIDILSFNGGKRMLFGLDWSPMFLNKRYVDDHIAPYLHDIRHGEHADLASSPSTKFYGEEPEFFSPHMFFARPDGESAVKAGSALWDVFQAYCVQYTKMLRSASVDPSPTNHIKAAERHAAYEKWHSERDPAIFVFRRLFGADWTDAYVRDVLFPGSSATL
eukprot:TRINITY_DN26152_c0_g1_i1.p1 TRINITY_DN26152_c0_g1~~TRINITY_DN26152_c0_g1_i1.p1  ORF type:complete len:354 (+),score=31.83 TRINITY_DN26152_c0_g1_i1:60-1121(+)